MVWDEQRADNQKRMEELRAQDVAPTAGLSRHPGFGEFGRKTKSHQILFFSISEFRVPPASSWAGNTTKTDATMQHISCFKHWKKSDMKNKCRGLQCRPHGLGWR